MRYGKITLPMPVTELAWVRSIKEGKVPFNEAMAAIREAEEELKDAVEHSALPEKPGLDLLTKWSYEVHVKEWSR